MKFLRVFETEQERQSVVSQLSYNTLSLAEGVLIVQSASGPLDHDHYIGTINVAAEGNFKILSGDACGDWSWYPVRVTVDGVELENLSEYINLTPGSHTIEIWDDPNNEGYYTMIQDDGYFQLCDYASMIIPDYVTSIGKMAFSESTSLTLVTILEGVTNIDRFAFFSCSSLTSVTIPDGVTSIGYEAFCACIGLTSITCNAINPPTLGDDAFYDTNNCAIYVPASSVDAYKAAEGWSNYADRIQAIQ